jgi:nucleoside transporter
MNSAIRGRLAIMMFLQYVIWGAWLPLLNLYLEKYLGFDGDQRAWITNAFAIASLTGWLFGGQLADRYFEQSKFLAFSHLIGGLSMLGLAFLKQIVPTPDPAPPAGNFQYLFWPMFGLMLLHCFFYVPTLSVTNAIAFANLKDAQKDFGFVRVWGTIGWIAASWPFIFILADWAQIPSLGDVGFIAWLGKVCGTVKTGPAMEASLSSTFLVAGVVSLVLAAFCLTLPRTPPKQGESSFAPFESFRYLAVPAILVLFVVTFFDSLVHYCYFFWSSPFYSKIGLAENWIAPAMSIGQIAEISTMAFLGFFLKRLGWRLTMILGVLGHVIRFGIYSLGAQHAGESTWIALVILSNVVHGFAYAFFFATVYIFVDENFPTDVRTSAQSLFNLLILGVGPMVGNVLWGKLGDSLTKEVAGPDGVMTKVTDFSTLFLYPLGFGLLAAAILVLFFHPPKAVKKATDPVPAEPEPALA